MYKIEVQTAFDSAHFLYGHGGKCRNIHGHRWTVIAGVSSDTLSDGMVTDFSELKSELNRLADRLDHRLIYQDGTLKSSTVAALESENFSLVKMDFRPTAENFAKYFYDCLVSAGFRTAAVKVYETPGNMAEYGEQAV
ncbi:MAG: 6-carboxytetrahydropterin synthase [Oscillospiraceae bacterium]|nr:6-carboxytetrahydropterin synthase [Oscillospiraceae bacterium]